MDNWSRVSEHRPARPPNLSSRACYPDSRGGTLQLDYQRVIDWLDDSIVERSGQFAAATLVLTAAFAAGATSPAGVVATTLDPSATTHEDQRRAIERANPAQVAAAVRTAADDNSAFVGLLSEDFNPRSASASASVTVVEHRIPEFDAGETAAGANPLTTVQREMQSVVASAGGDVRVFGAGIVAAEFENVIGDTLLVVVPAAAVLIVDLLAVAYRDLADLLLGVLALVTAIVWTFGFVGLAGIAFNQLLIAAYRRSARYHAMADGVTLMGPYTETFETQSGA